MLHIVVLVVALNQQMGYKPVTFDTKAACDEYLASDTYQTAETGLKDVLTTAGIPNDVTSTCEPIEQSKNE